MTPEPRELSIDRAADGGAGVGRDSDGRVVFVEGALPGERVVVQVTKEHKRHARARLVEVIEPSPGRRQHPCASGRAGCGGCDLSHASEDLQRSIKWSTVRDALVRVGRCDPTVVDQVLDLDVVAAPIGPEGYRTTVRVGMADARAGFRRAQRHDLVVPSECRVAHPRVEELLLDGRFGPEAGSEARIRMSVASGERLVVVNGDPTQVTMPDDVLITSDAELDAGREAFLTEEAAGRTWRVSARSFFQAGPAVATALVELVSSHLGDVTGAHIVDAYAGIGLLGGSLASAAASLTSVERSGSSTDDARVNLSDLGATIIESDVDRWTPVRADVVIADPARAGLGKDGVRVLSGCHADRFVLVSCDPGSLGRDIRLLLDSGYDLERVTALDAFAETSQVETVASLTRTKPA